MTADSQTSTVMQQEADSLKGTIFLPKTDFPMRGGLAQKEPEILGKWWKEGNIYHDVLAKRAAAEKFILHWGPPFANGHLHIGHALTYILKDFVIRAMSMTGKKTPSVTGWDCHGLPIEWKVEEEYRKQGKSKDDVSINEFRAECRAYAQKWKDVQLEEMKRFGILADWDNPYMTMDFSSEAAIAAELLKFVRKKMVYRALRPVLWSVVEKTALAEAETEYREHTSTTIYPAFKVKSSNLSALQGAEIVIWTTTPWTIPANRMVAFHDEIDYAVYEIKSYTEEAKYTYGTGRKIVIAKSLAEDVKNRLMIAEWTEHATFKGADIQGTICAHPLASRDKYYNFDVPAVHGDFVTTEQGTGFVHIAPSHGKDDFMLGRAHGVTVDETVMADGTYHPNVGLFAGLDIYTEQGKEGAANGAVIKHMVEAENLLGKGKLKHDYPHSWRSKSPLIFRATAQWYIDLDNSGLRQKAMAAIEDTDWFPAGSKNRIKAMVEGRPDWCISRQRVWGVPIAIFVNIRTGEILNDEKVHERVISIMDKEGADAWYARDKQDFLGPDYNAADYEQVLDVIDVWFESGSTHAFVCEKREDIGWPVDLYLEGSDQHRGWFQSSLLESCGTRDRAPFKQVLTHGFILDEKGYKMSKSLGNVMDPLKVCDEMGADILRLWVVNADFTDDVRIGPEILKRQGDLYRRLRNTLRYLLGNLDGFTPQERVPLADIQKMPELEQWIMHRLHEISLQVKQHLEKYEINKLYALIQNFCAVDLSALYFDIRKDSLYCDRPDSFARRSTRTVMEQIFSCLTAWLAPVLVFTTEEAWAGRPAGVLAEENCPSVHLRTFPQIPDACANAKLADKWARLMKIRRVVTGALEVERAEKRIGSSLEGLPHLYLTDKADYDLVQSVPMADICITSTLVVQQDVNLPEGAYHLDDVAGVAVIVKAADGHKCGRCWKILPEVAEGGLCNRCDDAVQSMQSVQSATVKG